MMSKICIWFIYSWFNIKVTWSVHSFNGDYLSIPEGTGSCEYLFNETPCTSSAPNHFLLIKELLSHFTIYFSNKLCHDQVFCMCVHMRQRWEKLWWVIIFVWSKWLKISLNFAQWFVNFVSWFILSEDEYCLSISVCICTQMYRCLPGLFVCLSVRLSRPQSMLTNSSQTHLIHPKWESNYPVLRVFFSSQFCFCPQILT